MADTMDASRCRLHQAHTRRKLLMSVRIGMHQWLALPMPSISFSEIAKQHRDSFSGAMSGAPGDGSF